MVAKKILLATDFSPLSDAALVEASSLARDAEALLLIVHVQETPLLYGEGAVYVGLAEQDEQAIAALMAGVLPPDPQVRYEHVLLSGDPATEIVHLAQREHVDLVVIGTHGRTGLRRLLMGSVAETVVRHAPCAVMTYRPTAHPELAGRRS